jgi:hypothetical protein
MKTDLKLGLNLANQSSSDQQKPSFQFKSGQNFSINGVAGLFIQSA